MKKILQISSLFLLFLFAQSVYAVNEECVDPDGAGPLAPPNDCCTAPVIIENVGGCPGGTEWIGDAASGQCALPAVCTNAHDSFMCETNTCWTKPIPGPPAACSTADINTGSSLPCCTDDQVAVRDSTFPTGWKCENKPVSLEAYADGIVDFLDTLMTELGVDNTVKTNIVNALTALSDGATAGELTALANALASFAIPPPPSDDVIWAGVTSGDHDGTANGYAGADGECASDYASSRVCSVEEIMTLRHKGELPGSVGGDEKAWINGGPPGFNSAANDCAGWKINDTTADNAWGRYWWFGLNQGWADGCNLTHRFACCK